jgi:hypothetical protein
MAMRVALAGLVVLSLSWPGRVSTPVGTRPGESVLAIVGDSALTRVDSRTLRPLPGRKAVLGRAIGPWSFGPRRSRVAVVARAARGQGRFLRVVDVRAMRVLWSVPLRPNEHVRAFLWQRARRLLAVTARGSAPLELLTLDPASRRVLGRRRLPISGEPVLLGAATTTADLVLLSAAPERIQPARLLVVDAVGRTRRARLARIAAGSTWRDDPATVERRIPALAVDPERRRAFVLAAGAPVAVVDLETLRVSYHELRERVSLLGRLRDWLEPTAHAKASDGPSRYARWLGNGLIGLTGSDDHTFVDVHGEVQMTTNPAGLSLVDVDNWTVRRLDETTSFFDVADGLLLASGWSWDSTAQQERSFGVAAYGLGGVKRFHVFPGSQAYVEQAFAGLAYVRLGERNPLAVVDLSSGRIVGHRSDPLPQLLADETSW